MMILGSNSIWRMSIGLLLLVIIFTVSTVESRFIHEQSASQFLSASTNGTRWAVLVAGSNEYYNYRHQADVCHAYQILKNGGLKDENIIVFMYDDIAYNEENPTPGVIVNKPFGPDVYHGVPKDYTGDDTTAENLYNVLLGNKEGLTGGSGKVLKSGPDDLVFFYYADHGTVGLVGMPVGDYVYADKLNKVLRSMYEAKMFKKMLIYIEACESGSMMDGLLPDNLNIYATTASNPYENSWASYCPGDDAWDVNQTAVPGSPEFYGTCLGDFYSIAWLEDSDVNDLNKETLEVQYQRVKKRTTASHVMQYGDMDLSIEFLSTFMGSNPNNTKTSLDHQTTTTTTVGSGPGPATHSMRSANQRDAKLAYLKNKVVRAAIGSPERVEAEKRLEDEMSHREQVDVAMEKMVNMFLFFSGETTRNAYHNSRPAVDDWDCFNKMVNTYQEKCGAMSPYAKKYTGVLAKLCNAGVSTHLFAMISKQACSSTFQLVS